MNILVTGVAGFIGFHVAKRLLEQGENVVGIDNINSYYDVELKLARLAQLGINTNQLGYAKKYISIKYENFYFVKLDIADREKLPTLFENNKIDYVIHLAAQAGVRYSLKEPFAYVDSNIYGYLNVLECCRFHKVKHLTYASSSSVYGDNKKVPFSESDVVDSPVSLYAATKRANELMATCYSRLYGIQITGLRFFTVYGPWGRPDMAPVIFTRAILNNTPIKVFNHGDLMRDFTYIDDIVEGVIRANQSIPGDNKEVGCHRIYNIGCSRPIRLMEFIKILENELQRTANTIMLPMQPGDVQMTYADTTLIEKDLGYKPMTPLKEGLHKFVEWWLSDLNPIK